MIVSHHKKFIYVSIPKTGSRSIQESLRGHANSFAIGNSANNHNKINQILQLEKFEEDLTFKLSNSDYPYSIIANMRNPWERLVSLYKYSYKYRKVGVVHVNNKCLRILFSNTSSIKDLIKLIHNRDKDYQKYWFKKHDIEINLIWALESFFESQNKKYSYLDSYLNFNKYKEKINIINFENLQEDFGKVCTKLSLPYIKISHMNKTNHKHYTEYYDDETREVIAEKYEKDIEYLRYKFGE